MLFNEIGVESNGIFKSISDKKDYKIIKLKNGLRVLLISDLHSITENSEQLKQSNRQRLNSEHNDSVQSDESDCESDHSSGSESGESDEETEKRKSREKSSSKRQAAAALCIDVGSFKDPFTVPGLAHLLEHMVFMGSTKYPDENKFDSFIKRHGGSDNASTDTECTVFQFDIQPEFFAEALDIWAQFFISPLLKKDSIDREMKAVDSEFSLALNSDYCKKEQLFSSLVKKDHVMRKFMWGNLYSLTKVPESNYVEVYSALKHFYEKYYVANVMTLALQAPETLENLEKLANDIFCEISSAKNSIEPPNEEQCSLENHQPFTSIHLNPVKNTHEVTLMWVLPPQQKYYKIKPIHYVSWLVGHEGKGSILACLRKKQLATALSGGNTLTGYENNRTGSLFSITVTLTENGFSKFEEVIDIIFKYLKYLQTVGPQERVFNEMQRIENINFMFQEDRSPLENVEEQCENLRLYPDRDVLCGDDIIQEYNAGIITDVLSTLTPSTCLIYLSSPENKDLLQKSKCKKEPWFNTEYVVLPIKNDWVKKWRDVEANTDAEKFGLHLPPPNQLIAEKFDLKGKQHEYENVEPYPTELSITQNNYNLWFKQDFQFKLPKGYINISLGNSIVSKSPHNRVCLDIMISILCFNMAEVVYDADAACLDYGIKIGSTGCLELKFTGFDDKLPKLVSMVTEFLADFKTTEDVFFVYLEQQKKAMNNQIIKPAKLGNDLRLSIIEFNRWSLFDKLAALKELTYQQFQTFSKNYANNLSAEFLIQGNYQASEAKVIADEVAGILKIQNYIADNMFNERIVNLPSNPQYCKIKGVNLNDENSSITVYYQIGCGDIKQTALLELLISILEEPCFDILRTKQQLGYDVYAQQHNTSGIIGFSIRVQSQKTKHSVEKVDQAILKFVNEDMSDIINKLTLDEFETQVDSLIALKENDDSHLGEEVERNWAEITSQSYNFNRIEREIKHLDDCKLSDLKQLYTTVCKENSKVLHVQVEGNMPLANKNVLHAVKLEYLTPVGVGVDGEKFGNYIMDAPKFKQFSALHPVCHIKFN